MDEKREGFSFGHEGAYEMLRKHLKRRFWGIKPIDLGFDVIDSPMSVIFRKAKSMNILAAWEFLIHLFICHVWTLHVNIIGILESKTPACYRLWTFYSSTLSCLLVQLIKPLTL